MADVYSLTLFRAQPERSQALGAHLLDLAAVAVQDEGCLDYRVFQGSEDNDLWVVQARWISLAAQDDHFNQPHTLAFLDELPKLADEVDLYPLAPKKPTAGL
ncbi:MULTISPECIES: putative quinol monooxygenase [unclassified Pseudomonas]|uniref:putative quinol monooxygenase n=1 Tax=unclassified Pseudomonas TaxID=196821 RepID=UPI00235DF35E|nr:MULTISPECIES: antibiotic biosynthesis monooxygenase [unclassified Pseudomonas]MDR6178464.1 quinol monooxygenase YgiN [Pseudomonas sp. SORGH_AS_0211]